MLKMLSNMHFDFMGKRKIALALSVTLVIASMVSLMVNGLNFGIDFTGGTLVEVGYPKSVELNDVRSALGKSGFDEAVVQYFGTSKDVLIRVGLQEGVSQDDLRSQILKSLQSGDPDVELRRNEFVGPQVGEELTEQGSLAVLYALLGILVYVSLRFEYRFSVGAVVALVHDVSIVMGIFSVLQISFDLTVLAALLAVIGYSLNDTIVVFDRIRENFRKFRKGEPIEVMNASINQTLSRTLVTSLTTLLVLLALFFIGGEVIHSFSLALILGIVVGTYSSIYVASAAALALGVSKADLMPAPKENEEMNRP